MGISNNDYNWRLVAASAIAENVAVKVSSAGKAAVAAATGDVHGICPQAIASGARCPVIRGGTLSGLVGFSAGDLLKVQSDGTLATAGSGKTVAIVKSEDASTAVILTGALDSLTSQQQAAVASLTGAVTAGVADGSLEAVPDPTDAPATADALRDDLVATTLPAIRNDLAELAAKQQAVLVALRAAGLIAP